jgi:hypothetical protein
MTAALGRRPGTAGPPSQVTAPAVALAAARIGGGR